MRKRLSPSCFQLSDHNKLFNTIDMIENICCFKNCTIVQCVDKVFQIDEIGQQISIVSASRQRSIFLVITILDQNQLLIVHSQGITIFNGQLSRTVELAIQRQSYFLVTEISGIQLLVSTEQSNYSVFLEPLSIKKINIFGITTKIQSLYFTFQDQLILVYDLSFNNVFSMKNQFNLKIPVYQDEHGNLLLYNNSNSLMLVNVYEKFETSTILYTHNSGMYVKQSSFFIDFPHILLIDSFVSQDNSISNQSVLPSPILIPAVQYLNLQELTSSHSQSQIQRVIPQNSLLMADSMFETFAERQNLNLQSVRHAIVSNILSQFHQLQININEDAMKRHLFAKFMQPSQLSGLQPISDDSSSSQLFDIMTVKAASDASAFRSLQKYVKISQLGVRENVKVLAVKQKNDCQFRVPFSENAVVCSNGHVVVQTAAGFAVYKIV